MTKNNFYVLSGAMGGGKSAVLASLKAFGIPCIPEPTREILAEQRQIKATGVPEKNADLFCMMSGGHLPHWPGTIVSLHSWC